MFSFPSDLISLMKIIARMYWFGRNFKLINVYRWKNFRHNCKVFLSG